MNQKVKEISGIHQVAGEFKIFTLIALVTAAVVWLMVSLNLLWAAAAYLGFLVFISLLYRVLGSSADAAAGGEGSSR